MDRIVQVALGLGAVLVVAALATQGVDPFLGHVWDHVVVDLTVELWVHVLLAGIALLLYSGIREFLLRRRRAP